ncbi:hypothetical protein HFZ78_05245 [Priestia megaterium]|uniref:Uncharacterized protein n=1 Tax=Priestia megaterium TaxID=1404 RepID=A0A6H1NY11_PRIMG|nr:hypothetical protein [Priestia megaterium]QIZ06204.1 hypothetical protein HFZ78_05245 [Priestia megaterium]
MNREVAIYKNKKYKAYICRVAGKIRKIELFSNRKEIDFKPTMSAYTKDLYVREVYKEDVTELFREYFMAQYKNYEFFVVGLFKDCKEIETITVDPTIARECNMVYQDRDLFKKRLDLNDDYQLIHVKEDYLKKTTTRKEVTLEESYAIDNEKFEYVDSYPKGDII